MAVNTKQSTKDFMIHFSVSSYYIQVHHSPANARTFIQLRVCKNKQGVVENHAKQMQSSPLATNSALI